MAKNFERLITIRDNFDNFFIGLDEEDFRDVDEKATRKRYEKMLMKKLSPLIRQGWEVDFEWTSGQPDIIVEPIGDLESDKVLSQVEDIVSDLWKVGKFWVER
jgi:homospermidine synthase